MSVRFETYRGDGTKVVGVITDLGLQLVGPRQDRWLCYVSQFELDGETFTSACRSTKIDSNPNGLALREAHDLEELEKRGFFHMDAVE